MHCDWLRLVGHLFVGCRRPQAVSRLEPSSILKENQVPNQNRSTGQYDQAVASGCLSIFANNDLEMEIRLFKVWVGLNCPCGVLPTIALDCWVWITPWGSCATSHDHGVIIAAFAGYWMGENLKRQHGLIQLQYQAAATQMRVGFPDRNLCEPIWLMKVDKSWWSQNHD